MKNQRCAQSLRALSSGAQAAKARARTRSESVRAVSALARALRFDHSVAFRMPFECSAWRSAFIGCDLATCTRPRAQDRAEQCNKPQATTKSRPP